MQAWNSRELPGPPGDGTEQLYGSDLHTLSVCAETALPDGRYFHSKAETLEAQRGESTCSVTQQTTEASFRFQIWATTPSKAVGDLEGGVGRMRCVGKPPNPPSSGSVPAPESQPQAESPLLYQLTLSSQPRQRFMDLTSRIFL